MTPDHRDVSDTPIHDELTEEMGMDTQPDDTEDPDGTEHSDEAEQPDEAEPQFGPNEPCDACDDTDEADETDADTPEPTP